jgi:asparagine synthase (glutamine-hydrolysing)
MYDEPFADSSQIPTHLVSKLARRHVTVALSGDGGDELFCGYPRYDFLHSLWNAVRKIPGPIARGAAKVIHLFPPSFINSTTGRLPLPQRLRHAPGEKLHRLAGHLSAQDPAEIYLRAITMWPDPSALVLNSHEYQAVPQAIRRVADMPDVREMAMLTDLANYLPDDILTKVDRASMAIGLEARVPLLDHRVVEFAWRLPLHFKVRNRKTKWVLRQVLYQHVPAELVERPKMGFGVPIDLWLRGPLREWAEDLLAPETLGRHGLFSVEPIRKKWKEHLSGARDWHYLLWPVLMFQAWMAEASSGSRQAESQAQQRMTIQPT